MDFPPSKEKDKSHRTRLTLQEKIEMLNDFTRNGLKQKDLAEKYKVHHTCVTKILAQRDSLLAQAENIKRNCGDVAKVKKYSSVLGSPFEKSVYMWFIQKRNLNQPLSVTLLKAKAIKFHEHFYGPASSTKFTASDGWVQKFRQRHGLRMLSAKGEQLSADPENAKSSGEGLNKFIEEHGYDLNNVYNADETALFWKLLPNRTLAAKFETEVTGWKVAKDRVTLHVAANATGTHKVPLTMIGKSQFPRCFRNTGLDNLPFIYKSQEKGWMSRKVFMDWYYNVLLPSVKERNPDPNARFILIVDNALSHPTGEELNAIDPQCMVLFLPPNVTSIVQPLDQGVISALKLKYKMSFLCELDAQELQTSLGLIEFTKSWKLHNCAYILASAWNEISETTLKNTWNKLIRPNSTRNPEFISCASAPTLINRLPDCSRMTIQQVEDWIESDNEFPPWKPMSSQEIAQLASNQPSNYCDEEEQESFEEDEESIQEEECDTSLTSLLKSVMSLRNWAQKNPEIDNNVCFTLNTLKDYPVHKRQETDTR